MSDAAIAFGHIVGRLTVILGVELVGTGIAFIDFLIIFDKIVEVGLDILIRDLQICRETIGHTLIDRVVDSLFAVFLDVAGFIVTIA